MTILLASHESPLAKELKLYYLASILCLLLPFYHTELWSVFVTLLPYALPACLPLQCCFVIRSSNLARSSWTCPPVRPITTLSCAVCRTFNQCRFGKTNECSLKDRIRGNFVLYRMFSLTTKPHFPVLSCESPYSRYWYLLLNSTWST